MKHPLCKSSPCTWLQKQPKRPCFSLLFRTLLPTYYKCWPPTLRPGRPLGSFCFATAVEVFNKAILNLSLWILREFFVIFSAFYSPGTQCKQKVSKQVNFDHSPACGYQLNFRRTIFKNQSKHGTIEFEQKHACKLNASLCKKFRNLGHTFVWRERWWVNNVNQFSTGVLMPMPVLGR